MELLLLLLVAGVVSVVLLLKAHRKKKTGLLAEVGRRRGGRVVAAGLVTPLRLEFSIDGVPAEVSSFIESETQWTRVRFQSGAKHRLHLTPQGATWLRNIFGTEIQIGDGAFDRAFWIESTDPAWAKSVLTPYLRQRLLHLHSVLPGGAVSLDIGPGGVMLKIVEWLVEDAESLDRFIDLSVLLLREVRKIPPPAGVVIASVETKSGSHCPVCGQVVVRGTTCRVCRTPQHEDCWKYWGGCAIFGCAGRRSGPQAAA